MKRFWLVLLSLGLVMAFSVSAFAVDVKVSGEYYIVGMYLDKDRLNTEAYSYTKEGATTPTNVSEANSTAFFAQRFRLGADFIVSPCLKLVTRADIMEGVWGGNENATTFKDEVTLGSNSRNMEWELTYIEYVSPIGTIKAGYMLDYGWGTIWGNKTSGPTAGQIQLFAPVSNTGLTIFAGYAKERECNFWVDNNVTTTDTDFDSLRVGPIYKFNTDQAAGETGVLFIFNHDASGRNDSLKNYIEHGYVLQPYFKSKIGRLALQGEVNYYWGDRTYEDGSNNRRIDSLSAWLDGDANFGIFSVGGSAAFVQGQVSGNADVVNNRVTGGRDWDPCLIMFNNTTTNTWLGPILGADKTGAAIDGEMKNAWFGQLRAAVTPVPEFTGGMSVSYAAADKKPVDSVGSSYGWEADVTGTYKITNNLSYMLGVGYLFTGDFFKNVRGPHVKDDYMLINRLTLNF
jgi:hypothetical protein